METYIDRIKEQKSRKRLTNEQLAELSGIPLGTLSKLLAGMSESPKLSNIVALCSALDCSVEYVITGVPDNTNNYTLSQSEIILIETYRDLDRWGKETVNAVLTKEAERVLEITGTQNSTPLIYPIPERVLHPTASHKGKYAGTRLAGQKRSVLLYELPVSAGPGVYLDDAHAETISIPVGDKTEYADYALRISGNSMEPKYHDGDIILVQDADSVEVGEPGVFLLDGSGFFKIYGGNRLISLNPQYQPILLKDFSDVQCKGRVVGRLRRK